MTYRLSSEQVKSEISHHISPAVGWLRMEPNSQVHMKRYLERVQLAADAVSILSGEIEWEYNLIEKHLSSGYESEIHRWITNLDEIRRVGLHWVQSETRERHYSAKEYSYKIVKRPVADPYETIEEL